MLLHVGLRVELSLPRTRVFKRLTLCERKTKYRTDGEWEHSAESGTMIRKEVIK